MISNRRIAVGRAVAAGLALVAAFAIVGSFAATPALAASKCPSYLFIGVRGSGESQKTMGPILETEWTKLQKSLAGASVAIRQINLRYPAVGFTRSYSVFGRKLTVPDFESRRYGESVAKGVARIVFEAARCKKSKLILSGYSQGAQVVMLALGVLDRRRVVAATLFGNPMFHADSYATQGDPDPTRNGLAAIPHVDPYPSDLKGRLFDYCRARDPICQGFADCHRSSLVTVHCDFDRSFGPHTSYKDLDTDAAAANIARLIRDDQAAQGNAIPEPSPASKGPVDVVFTIDTTGSMGDVISSVSADVQSMAAQLASTEPDFRLALVAYRDAPPECDDDYQARVVQDFTTDTAAFNGAVDSLDADGGCDEYESVYSGIMQGLSLGWRPSVTRVLVAIGDANGHSPDPATGYVATNVIQQAQAASVAIYGLDVGDASATFDELASATGGQVFSADDADQVPVAIQQAIAAQAAAPSADAGGGWAAAAVKGRAAQSASGYVGPVGAPIMLSAASSWSPLGRALTYSWDFDADGTIDQTADRPIVAHTYATPYDGDVTLRVTDSAGQTAVRRVHMTASGEPIAAPAKPRKLKLKRAGRGAKATWRRGRGGGRVAAWVIRNRRGTVIGYAKARKGAVQRFKIRQISKGKPFRVRVSALNAGGESAATRPSRAVRRKVRR